MPIGIPDRNFTAPIPNIQKSVTWEFVIQQHNADRVGLHYDLRLGDPSSGYGHSWALRNLPSPGQRTLAVMQPTHTIDYFDFKGTIGPGYGAGTVSTLIRDKVDIISASPDKITFYKYDGSSPTKYTLIRLNDKDWLLTNNTVTKEILNLYKENKKIKMKDLSKTYTAKEGDTVLPKIDGAYSTILLKPGKTPVVIGSRISKKTNQPIEYTPKIKSLLDNRPPSDLKETILRGEVYGITPEGEELPNRTLGGILNANVWNSRQKQEELNTPLRVAAFDVIKYNGKSTKDLSITEKMRIIEEINSKYPYIDNPLEVANNVRFNEGNVIWRNNKPYKVKNKADYDVFVRNVFTDKTGNKSGGFDYSFTPKGEIIGRVGTGFTNDEKLDMYNNPDLYAGRVATLNAMGQMPSGNLRAPSFRNWHLSKGEF